MRMARLTDYALLLLFSLAHDGQPVVRNARDLARATGLPLPTVSKLLKALLQGGLLESHRGIKGGYSLARSPQEISLAEVIRAVEGPIGLTECSIHPDGGCTRAKGCPVGGSMRRVSSALRHALERLALSDLIWPRQDGPLIDPAALLAASGRRTS